MARGVAGLDVAGLIPYVSADRRFATQHPDLPVPHPDLVIGLDASTTGVKGIALDRHGRAVAEARAAYPLTRPAPGYVEQQAEDWWRALTDVLRQLVSDVGAGRIAALSIGHQRETFVLIDAAGNALRPAILWVDERSRPQVARLSAEIGRDRLRDLTGKPPDPTPALFAIAWLSEHEPERLRQAHALVDVSAYFHYRLTGRLALALPSADPLGLVDLARGAWDPELVRLSGLRLDQLPVIVAPGAIVGGVTAAAVAATGLDPATRVVAAAGDGQLAGLGVGVLDAQSGYLSLGSSIVAGLFGEAYHTSEAYRTLGSATGQGYLFETVLRSGMQMVDWVARTLAPGEDLAAALRRLEQAAEAVPAGSDGLMVLPYFAGMMNPHWDEAARGAMIGLRLGHTQGHIYRAALEGIAMEQSLALSELEASVGHRPERFIACGGGTKSALFTRIMASALGRPLMISPEVEAVALGAAVLAASAIGWHDGEIPTAAKAMVAGTGATILPDPVLSEVYGRLLPIYRQIFAATRPLDRAMFELAAMG